MDYISISEGDPSSNTTMQFLTTGVTVTHTIAEKMNVQIGSAILQLGL